MRFCPWYPLAEAAVFTPATANVVQVRCAEGLVTYPNGKSAMVRYAYAADARAAAVALSRVHREENLLCRHLIEWERTTDLAAFCEKLRGDFVRRFGAVPMFERAV